MTMAQRGVRQLIQQRETFHAGNVFGGMHRDLANHSEPTYVVYSYGTHWPMFIWVAGEWYENASSYSRSTSRQTNVCRPCANTHKLTNQQMNLLLLLGPVRWVERQLEGAAA